MRPGIATWHRALSKPLATDLLPFGFEILDLLSVIFGERLIRIGDPATESGHAFPQLIKLFISFMSRVRSHAFNP